jgi:hypothetical protein
MAHYLFLRKWSYFVTKARYLATFSLSHLSLVCQLSSCSHFRSPENLRQKNKNIKNPKKSFLTVFSTKCRFAFSYSVNKYEKYTKCFYLTFVLVKPISKRDRGSLYKFHPRKKWNASSDLASFHAHKRI